LIAHGVHRLPKLVALPVRFLYTAAIVRAACNESAARGVGDTTPSNTGSDAETLEGAELCRREPQGPLSGQGAPIGPVVASVKVDVTGPGPER
jgi:hypothetical protein